MKNCQEQNKKISKILFFLIFCLTINFILFSTINIKIAEAQEELIGPPAPTKFQIFVSDAKVAYESAKNTVGDTYNSTQEMLQTADKWLNDRLGARFYKASLKYFLNTLAYETATYLASGDEGQGSMIEERGWDGMLKDTADNAAGSFINDVVSERFSTKFNLCEPSFDVKLKIGLGLVKSKKPEKPDCSFTEMTKNWKDEATRLKDMQKEDFLAIFQKGFNPWENDLGIALSLQTGMESEISKKVNEASSERFANNGWLSVKDPISGKIKTPASVVEKSADKAIEDSTSQEKIYTEDYLADAIDIFINTLAGTLIEKWLKEGLVTNFTDVPTILDNLSIGDFTAVNESGTNIAKNRFRDFIEPSFGIRGDYNILAELTSCTNPTKAGPTNCVINDNFKQGVINKMTVGKAMQEGYLNANGVFGFYVNGLEPSYNEGYPYRSMKILRKFRIIPAGWEIASQYINEYLGETRNLGDLVACYDPTDKWAGYSAVWCEGLVDPNWVLKAPLNYCKREGPGPEIISESVMGGGYDSELSIMRNNNYCADEQSCIKENADGSCQLYGYCTEERRRWNFNTDSCEPEYNTCQTFRNRDGSTGSYLENSLNYSGCAIDNVGCDPRCISYDYGNQRYDCTLGTTGDKVYLDRDAEECDEENENCSEFIRTKPGLGTNLLINSSFEEIDVADTIDDGLLDTFNIWGNVGEAVSDSYSGLTALQLSANLNHTVDVGPADYLIGGDIYTLSFYAKDCSALAGDDFQITGQTSATVLEDGSEWRFYQTTYIAPEALPATNQVSFNINTGTCIIDAIKLERSVNTQATAYRDYREAGLIYEKALPDYLEGVCYENLAAGDYRLDPDAPQECYDFARKCNRNEVGCELYTSMTDDLSVPAKVTAWDYCPSECVGYDAYVQGATNFDIAGPYYFIPQTAKTCGASAVGCDEFTNLDAVGMGGEAREYFTYLRSCIKPTDPLANCSEFYTWEGDSESGFQLRVHTLDAQGVGVNEEPVVTLPDALECNATIYALPPTNPGHNDDCREFFNTSGGISYHLYKRTISCSDDCHPYRRTDDGIVYDAIPSEGITCSAASSGCREYSGSVGNNMRNIINHDFEGSAQGWIGFNGATSELSNEALTAGGESLWTHDANFSTQVTVGETVFFNKSYVVNFIAKANGATNLNISLENSALDSAGFGGVVLGVNWQYYELNLANLNHVVDAGEVLNFIADNEFYIDNVKLIEIVDRYYLIKDSWATPTSCNQDAAGNPSALYALGCDQYSDRDDYTHYLKSFTYLCEESAVGCDVLIDTHNYSNYDMGIWNDDNGNNICDFGGATPELDCLITPADSFVYMVWDEDKSCGRDDKGCQRLGDPYTYEGDVIYSDIYLKNNPDDYSTILCEQEAVDCEEWTTTEGLSFFKDPGNNICEFRKGYQIDTSAWYQKKINRCDDNDDGSISAGVETIMCLDNDNCGAGIDCILDNNDYACSVNSMMTFGHGGNNRIDQPTGGWTGLCPANQAGCVELIDPVSSFAVNSIFNGNFSDIDGDGFPADGWSAGSQLVDMDIYTLYRLAGTDNPGSITITCSNDIFELERDNRLVNLGNSYTLALANNETRSILFYSGVNSACTIDVTNTLGEVELKKVIIDYQLKQDLDKQTCNGIVDFDDGCVLFNERSQNGSAYLGLDYDADMSPNGSGGPESSCCAIPVCDDVCDSNVLLKVSPDRVCNEWLACRSQVAVAGEFGEEEKFCFDIGLCNGVDENGSCNSFVVTDKVNETYDAGRLDELSNISGYAKVGFDWGGGLAVDGSYPFAEMDQTGEFINIPNSNFEFAGSNKYPIGWSLENGSWTENIFKVIDNPFEAQVEGIQYAPEGENFLKLAADNRINSEFAEIINDPGIDYVITVYANTMDLKNGSARVDILEYDISGGPPINTISNVVTPLSEGEEWTFKLGEFNVLPITASIKVALYSDAITSVGNVYFDNIMIRPALESKSLGGGNEWYTPQSCRLYPEDDSLSCEYYDDSGIRKQGWQGYCLEYDSYPGSPDACLTWWPTEKVKGEGIEEGAGYLGKIPVYYCLEATGYCFEPNAGSSTPQFYCDK
ncbi:MAG: hypothetical protein ABIA02_00005, partial [Candidatus Falkowbacteria bacterium]